MGIWCTVSNWTHVLCFSDRTKTFQNSLRWLKTSVWGTLLHISVFMNRSQNLGRYDSELRWKYKEGDRDGLTPSFPTFLTSKPHCQLLFHKQEWFIIKICMDNLICQIGAMLLLKRPWKHRLAQNRAKNNHCAQVLFVSHERNKLPPSPSNFF